MKQPLCVLYRQATVTWLLESIVLANYLLVGCYGKVEKTDSTAITDILEQGLRVNHLTRYLESRGWLPQLVYVCADVFSSLGHLCPLGLSHWPKPETAERSRF